MESAKPDPKEPDPRALALGRRIKRLRERADRGQQQVADLLGVHVNTVRGWERGAEMSAIDVPSLAAALRTDVATLLGVRGEVSGLAPNRSETAYLLLPEAVARIKTASHINELRDLYEHGLRAGIEIETAAEEVTRERWGEARAEIEAAIARLGGIPREWRERNG